MKIKLLLVFIVISNVGSSAQSPQSAISGPTTEDYQRAVSYLWSNLINKKIFNLDIQPIWAQDSTGLGFITQDIDGKSFKKIVFDSNLIQPLFDQRRVAGLITDSLKIITKEQDLPITNLECNTFNHLEFKIGGNSYLLDLPEYKFSQNPGTDFDPLVSKSPDGKWLAYTDKYNIYIKSTQDGSVKQLSSKGERLYEYGTYYGWSDIIEGENGERPKRLLVNWSPDSRWFQTYITDMRYAPKMYLLDWSIDTIYKPKLLSYYRGSPGDTDMVKMIPVFYNVSTGEEYIKYQLQSTHTDPIQYEWSSLYPGMVYQENTIRGYQSVELYRCDLYTKKEELLYRETSNTNIDNYESNIIEPWNKAIITTERSGWKQLYLLDLTTKALTPLTSGTYYVNEIVQIDTLNNTVFFSASGKEPGRNPYQRYLYRLGLSDLKEELLTPEDANHDISISPDGLYFVDNISTLDQPTHTILKRIGSPDSTVEISRAAITGLDSLHFRAPESFTAIGRDGLTTLYGAIWKPTTFDSTKIYPIIDQTYTGPHTFMYPRNFSSALARSNQSLAELGFIIITVDGMGTTNRSKAFHNVSYKNMGKNLEDHRLAILQLGRQYNWIDTTRVGIFGHSAGGFDAAHAVLEYPDFYKVAVASSADHDFRMEKDWWPEMYMGWPVDSTYNLVSNITMAKSLKGKLLITHGGIDENVNPSATFKLAEALIRANKEFDMLILPSQRHGYQGIYNQYFTKKKWNYFVEHLLGAKAMWDIKME